MWKVIVMASGLYIMSDDGILVEHYKMNVPHKYAGTCRQERELHEKAVERIIVTTLPEIPGMLERENLGNENPAHDWCAPRYQMRRTIPLHEIYPAMMAPRPSAEPKDGVLLASRAPLPPRRPRALPGM